MMKKNLWFVLIVALGLFAAGCNSGDPAPTVGDAEITKGMPDKQEPPPSARARQEVQGEAPGPLTPPPP